MQIKSSVCAGLCLAIILVMIFTRQTQAAQAMAPLPLVNSLKPDAISRALFTGPEQAVAGHLASVAALANTVDDRNPDTYGFIRGSFWRAPLLEPFNARIQESVFTMAYFYATDRPWNPYYRDPALLGRLQAALTYWLKLQFPDGSFPELNADHHSLTAVGFGLQCMYFIIDLLADMPDVDADLLAKADASAHNAAYWALTDKNTWDNMWSYSNQVVGAMLGVALFLPKWQNAQLNELFNKRLAQLDIMQSPAGFFYENNGPGHQYSVQVMLEDLSLLYELTNSPIIVGMQERYLDWLSYNFLYEPGSSGFAINTAIDTRALGWRYTKAEIMGVNNLVSKTVPLAAAFAPDSDAINAQRESWYQGSWNGTQVLSYVPPEELRSMFHKEHYATAAEKQAAIATLPYHRSTRFTENRIDRKTPQHYLFIRRPAYYMGVSLGARVNNYQRMGMAFLWHPQMGTVVQSQNTDNTYAWSTAFGIGRKQSDSLGQVIATFSQGGSRVSASNLRDNDFTLSYPLIGSGSKQITFHDSGIEVAIRARNGFTERIPLVLSPQDTLTWLGSSTPPCYSSHPQKTTATGFQIKRNQSGLTIHFKQPVPVEFRVTEVAVGGRLLHLLLVEGGDELTYTLEFD